jgi:hypothetical protein
VASAAYTLLITLGVGEPELRLDAVHFVELLNCHLSSKVAYHSLLEMFMGRKIIQARNALRILP